MTDIASEDGDEFEAEGATGRRPMTAASTVQIALSRLCHRRLDLQRKRHHLDAWILHARLRHGDWKVRLEGLEAQL